MALESDLPVNILLKIFRNLPRTNYILRRYLFAPLSVCRRWRTAVLEQPEFWTDLDILIGSTRSTSQAGPESLKRWLQRTQKSPLNIELTLRDDAELQNYMDYKEIMGQILARASRWKTIMVDTDDGDAATTVLKFLPRTKLLESLSLDATPSAGFLPSSWSMRHVSQTTLIKLTQLHLRYLDLSQFPNFRAPNVKDISLSFLGCKKEDFDRLMEGFPNVENLVLYHCSDSIQSNVVLASSTAASPPPPPEPPTQVLPVEAAPLLEPVPVHPTSPPPTPPPLPANHLTSVNSEASFQILTSLTSLKLRRHYHNGSGPAEPQLFASDAQIHALYAHVLDRAHMVKTLLLEICCLIELNSPASLEILQTKGLEKFETLEIHIRAPGSTIPLGFGDDIPEPEDDMHTDIFNWPTEAVYNFFPKVDTMKHLIISGPHYTDVRLTPFFEVLTRGIGNGTDRYPFDGVNNITLKGVCAEPEEVLEFVRARTARSKELKGSRSEDNDPRLEFKPTLEGCPGLPDIREANLERLEYCFENLSSVNLPFLH